MALYQYTFEIPADTPKDKPKEHKLLVKDPVIFMTLVTIPPGHVGLTGLQITYGLEMISPTRTKRIYDEIEEWIEEWITGDAEIVTDYPYYELPELPCWITLRGYNTDEVNPHKFIVRIIALPRWIVFWMKIIQKFTEMFARLVGI